LASLARWIAARFIEAGSSRGSRILAPLRVETESGVEIAAGR